jgi:hypothetical protein
LRIFSFSIEVRSGFSVLAGRRIVVFPEFNDSNMGNSWVTLATGV